MNKTAMQTLIDELKDYKRTTHSDKLVITFWICMAERLLEKEKEQMDNKVIHFAEWLTKKHSFTLMALYEHFEEEFYKETLD